MPSPASCCRIRAINASFLPLFPLLPLFLDYPPCVTMQLPVFLIILLAVVYDLYDRRWLFAQSLSHQPSIPITARSQPCHDDAKWMLCTDAFVPNHYQTAPYVSNGYFGQTLPSEGMGYWIQRGENGSFTNNCMFLRRDDQYDIALTAHSMAARSAPSNIWHGFRVLEPAREHHSLSKSRESPSRW